MFFKVTGWFILIYEEFLVVTLHRGDKDVANSTILLPELPLEIAVHVL